MGNPIDRFRTGVSDRYTIVREIGHGGMATVYLAEDRKHQRQVAVKILRPALADALGTERFLQEIRIAAGLSHPHIVPLYDSGEADGVLYYVMPFVEGESLRDRLTRERQLPLDDALALVRQVAAGLDYAHQQGVIHRDIKPENILLSRGEAVLADFGIAYAVRAAGGQRLTESGVSLGTPEYMSPEQASGSEAIDARSDIYSLAAVLYEMLTGEPPHTGPTAQAIVAKLMSQAPTPPRVVRDGVPDRVDRAVLRALAKVPADRFTTAGRFAASLADDPAAAVAPMRSAPGRRAAGWMVGLLAVAGAFAVGLRLATDRPYVSGRDWVLVTDFTGPPDDPGLANAVRSLALADLNQSRYVSTVPDELVRNAMQDAGIPETTRVDTRVGAELAFRTSVRVLLTGSVDRIGSGTYSVVMHVLDADDGSNVLSAAASASDEGDALVRAVQSVIREVRLGLGERRDVVEANRPLMRVRTPDLAALRSFSDAMDAVDAGNYAAGNTLLHQALGRDSSFAAAWAALAANHLTSRNLDSARQALGRAAALRERMSDQEWYRLQGDMAYALDDDVPAAVRWYDLYLQEQPRSIPARNNRALYLSTLGRHAEARGELETAVRIDPLAKGPAQIQLINLAAELVVVGDRDSARTVARHLVGAFRTYVDVLLLDADGDWAAAAERSAAVVADPSTEWFVLIPAMTSWAGAAAALGHVDSASSILTRAVADSRAGPAARWYARARLLLELATDHPPTRLTPPLANDTTAGGWLLRGLVAAAAGDSLAAERALAALAGADPLTQRHLASGTAVVRALTDARADRWRPVVDALEPTARAGEHDPFNLDRVDSFLLRWLVAQAYAGLDRPDSALAMLDLLLAPTGVPPSHYGLRGLTHLSGTRAREAWAQIARS